MKEQAAPAMSDLVGAAAVPPTPVIIKLDMDDQQAPSGTKVKIQTAHHMSFDDSTGSQWELSQSKASGNIELVTITDHTGVVITQSITPGSDPVSITLSYGNEELILAEQENATTGETTMYINSPNVAFNAPPSVHGKGWVDSSGVFAGSLTNVLVMQGTTELLNFPVPSDTYPIVTVSYYLA